MFQVFPPYFAASSLAFVNKAQWLNAKIYWTPQLRGGGGGAVITYF